MFVMLTMTLGFPDRAVLVPDWPDDLEALLSAPDPATQERAWEAFARCYSPIMLSAIQPIGHDRDRVMDAYAFVLETLHADRCRRLARYRANGRGSFTTWLTVVVRRLAIDHRRQGFGRLRRDDPAAVSALAARRRPPIPATSP